MQRGATKTVVKRLIDRLRRCLARSSSAWQPAASPAASALRACSITRFASFWAARKRGQRCLVVTDGFYEWKKLDEKGKNKQPYAIATAISGQMVMAGLWSLWKSPANGEEILSCTILTCGANKVMGELHDRMPVILDDPDWSKWLGEEEATEAELLAMLEPCPDEALKVWPVDKAVGNVRNKGAQLITPLADGASAPVLF
jgi:putative SOS response-associated peptidase YedK